PCYLAPASPEFLTVRPSSGLCTAFLKPARKPPFRAKLILTRNTPAAQAFPARHPARQPPPRTPVRYRGGWRATMQRIPEVAARQRLNSLQPKPAPPRRGSATNSKSGHQEAGG